MKYFWRIAERHKSYVKYDKGERKQAMTQHKNGNLTKAEILQVGTRLILNHGFKKASSTAICEELEISKGNLTEKLRGTV